MEDGTKRFPAVNQHFEGIAYRYLAERVVAVICMHYLWNWLYNTALTS